MLKEIKNVFAFLTVLPLRMDKDCLTDSSKYMFLFPIVGATIGFLAGLFGWATFQFFPALVAGALALGVLLLLTGLHHTDGLLDFGDALMYHGTPERKIEIMHDQFTGAGALGLGLMTYIATAAAFAQLNSGIVIQSLIVIELSAKLSMVIGAWAGNPVHQGMSSTFLEAMHGRKGDVRLLAGVGISFAVAIPLLRLAGVIAVLAAIISALIMVLISHRHFRGVTGDVLGATNELSRMVAAIMLLAMLR